MRQLVSLIAGTLSALLGAASLAHGEDAPAAAPPPGPSSGPSATGPHHIYLVGQLLVTEPWIASDAEETGQASAYFVIENRGGTPETLVSASSELADKVVVDANGPAPGLGDGRLTIAPRQTVELKPGGIHLQFQGLHRDIRNESTVPGIFVFERAGPLQLNFTTNVQDATPEDPADLAGKDAPSLVK